MGFENLKAEIQEVCKLKENLLATLSLKNIENQPLDFLGQKSAKTWLSEVCVLSRIIASSQPNRQRQEVVDELAEALTPRVKEFKNALQALHAQITNLPDIYAAPGSLYGRNIHGQHVDLATTVATAFNLWRSLENSLLLLFIHLKTDLGAAKKLAEIQEQAEKAAKQAISHQKKVSEVADRVKKHETEVQNALERININLEKAGEHLGEVRNILQEAEKLRKEIDEWKLELKNFKERTQKREGEIDDLLEKMAKQQNDVEELKRNVEGLKNKVEEVLRNAQTMLGFATGAGLSEAFRQSREHYQKQLYSSTRNLYISALIFIFTSTLIVGGYLFDLSWLPGLGPWLQKLGGESANQSPTFTGLLGRLVLVLPLIWIFLLQARTHNLSFHLQQAYRHRETITKALPSFQELTPNHQEEFLREVFQTAHRNPLPELSEKKKPRDEEGGSERG